MASQSLNLQASGSNSSVHANQSGSQVDLTLRLGLSKESDKNLPHFGPMNLPHAHLNFTAPYTTHQGINHIDMVCGRGNTAHNPWSPERRSHYMNSNGQELHSAASMGGSPLRTYSYNYNNIPPMPQMNEYTLLNPSSRRGDRGNGGLSSSRRTSRRHREANYNDPSKRCTNYNCGTNNTPMWRKGPLGPKSLCNACGIKYRKEEEKRKARGAAEHSGASSEGKD